MKIYYSVGARAGTTAEVDEETGRWMVAKRRAVEVAPEPPQDSPTEGDAAPRVKRKYVRKAPTHSPKGTDAKDEGAED